jgi:EAL domain-containing protein (putative c-di-GMP-specific phosphodiesterase class I)/GGDEF domain-containing protein
MQSINTVITKRFLKQALYPIFFVELTLVITLFALNNYQANENKAALQKITENSFNEIANHTSDIINKRFEYDKSNLLQIQSTAAILLNNSESFPPNLDEWIYEKGFFQLNQNHLNAETHQLTTPVYTTNLDRLESSDYQMLNMLKLLAPTVKTVVDEQNDLISSAWVNIDKRYALAYPFIDPAKELSPDLDVTQWSFYYLANPIYNPDKTPVFTPLYQEEWAINTGELGAYLMPIYHKKAFIGVIGLTLTAEAFADYFANMKLPFDNAYAMLVDNENRLILSSDNTASYRDFGRHSFYELFKQTEHPDRKLMSIDLAAVNMDEKILFDRGIGANNLRIIITADKSDVFSDVDTISSNSFNVAVGFLIAIIFFYWLFYRMSRSSLTRLANLITTPLHRIVDFSSKLGREEDVKLEPSDIDELQELNTNLNITHNKLLDMLIKDEESGLYNRQKLLDDLAEGTANSLMLFQLGNYKALQNLYGQEIIRAIIDGVVEELKAHPSIQSYRIGDDDFAVSSMNDDMEAFKLLYEAISSKTIAFESIQVHPFLFAGMAVRGKDGGALIERAGIALLYAQRNIASKPICYEEAKDIKAEFDSNLDWSNRINAALRDDLFIPYFQPIYNLHTKSIEKFESLVRLVDGENVVSPFYFISTAAAIGKSHEITKVMIEKVFRVAAQHPQISFNINISFKDFDEFDLVAFTKERSVIYGVSPTQITFELLETDALTNPELTLQHIAALKQSGFKIAIDDFGTGHSNFAHLMNMRVDTIKIDGQFIKNIVKDPNSASITKTIAQFASLVGAETVAEFVADESIMRRIRRFKIDYAQGYAVSPPLPEEHIKTVLHKEFNFF